MTLLFPWTVIKIIRLIARSPTSLTTSPIASSSNKCLAFNDVEDRVLKLLFPIIGPLKWKCLALFTGENWTTKKGSLIKHPECYHKIYKPKVWKWCLICGSNILHLRWLVGLLVDWCFMAQDPRRIYCAKQIVKTFIILIIRRRNSTCSRKKKEKKN